MKTKSTTPLSVRMTVEDHERLEAVAWDIGAESLSDVVRLALSQGIQEVVDARYGGNPDQLLLAHSLRRQGKLAVQLAQTQEEMAENAAFIEELQAKLGVEA